MQRFLSKALVVFSCASLLWSIGLAQTPADQDRQKRITAAVAIYREGNLERALELFRGLQEEAPDNPDVQAWLGFLYLRNNEGSKAVPLLELAIKQRPNDLEVLNNLGNAYYAVNELDKALGRYEQVSRLSPGMFEPWYNTGNIYLQRQQFPKAIEAYKKASALKQDDAYVHNNLGVAYESTKDFPNAATSFRKAADLRPDNATFARNAGLALVRLRRSPEALPYLERADRTDGAVGVALGDAYGQAGKLAEALGAYEGVKAPMAGSTAFWFNLGVLRGRANDTKGAEQAYRKALQLAPSDLDSLNNLGLLLFRAERYDEATVMFDRLSGLNPGSVQAKVNLGAAASRAGDMPRAIAAWKDVIRVEPARTRIRLDLANGLFETGDTDGARFHYNQVLSQNRNSSEALNGIGLLHLRESKLVQAEAAFRASITADKKNVPAYNNLAITLERMNRRSQAIQVLDQALKLAPDDPEIRRNLQRLRSEG